MKQANQEKRKREIEAAAYELLAECGYKATSMLAIARRASASNETLYKWYGNKQTLFRSMVEENAKTARLLFAEHRANGKDPLEVIKSLGPLLLNIVTGERAVALNRAAAGDVHETGRLGASIAAGGKQTLMPLIREVLQDARSANLLAFDDSDNPAEAYIALLIGDLQIERVIGVRAAPEQAEISARADWAYRLFLKAFAVGN